MKREFTHSFFLYLSLSLSRLPALYVRSCFLSEKYVEYIHTHIYVCVSANISFMSTVML